MSINTKILYTTAANIDQIPPGELGLADIVVTRSGAIMKARYGHAQAIKTLRQIAREVSNK